MSARKPRSFSPATAGALGERPALRNQCHAVGVLELDREHQQFVKALDAISRTVDQLNRRRPQQQDLDQVEESFSQLCHYARQHFQHEEQLMRQTGFPLLAEHQAAHQAFISRAREFRQRWERESVTLVVEIKFFLLEWFYRHVNNHDQKYVAHFRRLGITSLADAGMREQPLPRGRDGFC